MSKNMLGVALCEVRGLLNQLMENLCGKDWEKWLEALKTFLRGEPTFAEEMIYPPLRWSTDLGEIPRVNLLSQTSSYCRQFGEGWRLPTEKELARAMKNTELANEFALLKYYWTSTSHSDADKKMTVLYRHQDEGVSYSREDWLGNQKNPYLRLCRTREFA